MPIESETLAKRKSPRILLQLPMPEAKQANANKLKQPCRLNPVAGQILPFFVHRRADRMNYREFAGISDFSSFAARLTKSESAGFEYCGCLDTSQNGLCFHSNY
jgi:hypothetical protein